jgi:hypothetical protein
MYITVYDLSQSISSTVQDANHVHSVLCSLAVDIVNCSRREPCTFRSMLSRSRHRQLFKTRTIYILVYALSQSTSFASSHVSNITRLICSSLNFNRDASAEGSTSYDPDVIIYHF